VGGGGGCGGGGGGGGGFGVGGLGFGVWGFEPGLKVQRFEVVPRASRSKGSKLILFEGFNVFKA
jgi:hypothetical protein